MAQHRRLPNAYIFFLLSLSCLLACHKQDEPLDNEKAPTVSTAKPPSLAFSDAESKPASTAPISEPAAPAPPELSFFQLLAQAAENQTLSPVTYDASYVQLAYPAGDVTADRGVCADVVVRAYRTLGIDLQRSLHEDMKQSFSAYPNTWGLSRPDSNIDHRRVLNLRRYFERRKASLDITEDPADYLPGDIVSWKLSDGRPHIGVVASKIAPAATRPMIVHNIGLGAVCEDVLFEWDISGHYRYEEPAGPAIVPIISNPVTEAT